MCTVNEKGAKGGLFRLSLNSAVLLWFLVGIVLLLYIRYQ